METRLVIIVYTSVHLTIGIIYKNIMMIRWTDHLTLWRRIRALWISALNINTIFQVQYKYSSYMNDIIIIIL